MSLWFSPYQHKRSIHIWTFQYHSVDKADILAKADHLTTLYEIVKHSEVFETAQIDQSKLNEIANPSILRICKFCCQNQNSPTKP